MAPPKVTSQTSLPSQIGPIELRMMRRSSSVLADGLQDADAEVEAIEDGVAGEEYAEQDEPEGVEIHQLVMFDVKPPRTRRARGRRRGAHKEISLKRKP